MKISAFINELSRIRQESGDIDVLIYTDGQDVGIDRVDVDDCVNSETNFAVTEMIAVIMPQELLKVAPPQE